MEHCTSGTLWREKWTELWTETTSKKTRWYVQIPFVRLTVCPDVSVLLFSSLNGDLWTKKLVYSSVEPDDTVWNICFFSFFSAAQPSTLCPGRLQERTSLAWRKAARPFCGPTCDWLKWATMRTLQRILSLLIRLNQTAFYLDTLNIKMASCLRILLVEEKTADKEESRDLTESTWRRREKCCQ